jgi:capsular polysaccharide biosynthesis protein
MSDQTLDFKKSLHIVRRRLAVVGILAALGLIAGAGFTAFIDPPMSTSTALVALPATTADVTAQAVIAGSTPVLTNALGNVRPAVSLSALRRHVQVTSVTPDLLSITAVGATAAQAESTANAVADSYVTYIGSAPVPTGPVPAQVAVPATNATVVRPVNDILVTAGLGALAGALVGVIAALAIGRADRRLRERGEIADAIGVPVLASVPVRHPDNATRWTHLLEDYEPSVTEAWRLRKALGDLGLADMTSRRDGAVGSSLTVLSLSSDHQALALGPQLAVFAASAGIPTALVIGAEQSSEAAALRAAAAPSSRRSGNLRVVLEDRDNLTEQQETALSIVVAVVDSETPRVADLQRTRATLLGVSTGAVTADQLARVAASSASAGRHIAGILVADPDPADPTTGRLPQLARSVQERPTRMTSAATVSRRQTTDKAIR